MKNLLIIFVIVYFFSICEIQSNDKFRYKRENFIQYLLGGITKNKNQCNCKCGLPNRRSSKLLGGTALDPFEFPWLVNVQVKGILPIPGTLINDRYVITAASPLIGLTPYEIKILIGLHDNCNPDTTSITSSISDIFIHPEFLYETKHNDIAILKLTNIIPYSRRISPVCLPTPGTAYTGQVLAITSWIQGLPADNLTLTTCLPRKIGLPLLESKSCSENILNSQGCVGVVGSPNVLCKNDAGAGVLYKTYTGYYEMVGVLSDKQSCRSPPSINSTVNNDDYKLPIFTRLGNHLNWILERTRDGCYCNKL